MKNEKLSEVVETVCRMARYGIQKRYPSGETAANDMIERVALLEDKLVPILVDLEAVGN